MTVLVTGGNQAEVAKPLDQMRENLGVLDAGPMSDDELAHMRRIGDHVYGKKLA